MYTMVHPISDDGTESGTKGVLCWCIKPLTILMYLTGLSIPTQLRLLPMAAWSITAKIMHSKESIAGIVLIPINAIFTGILLKADVIWSCTFKMKNMMDIYAI